MSRRILNRFKVLKSLATGGMGEIFLADDAETGQQAVLKVLREDVDSDGATARFEHEIEVLKELKHPLIPKYLADGFWKGQRVVAVAHCDGMSLAEVMVGLKRALPVATSLFLMVDVLHALDSAHKLGTSEAPRGLVHRDISPHNVIVDSHGRGHLIDFGISTDRNFADLTPGVLVGKVAYMAPEQAGGFTVDARADQFACGVVLWELLTGRRLFRGESDRATWRNVLACDVPDLRTIVEVPEELAFVVARMLEPNRNLRFDSCAAAADSLLVAAADLDMANDVPVSELLKEAQLKRPAVRRPSKTVVLPEAELG